MVSFFITDIGKDIIHIAQHNLNLNNTKEDINFTVMELDWLQHYMIFVSDLRQVSGFLRVLGFINQ
jgi:aminopeptidase-like protein